MIITRKNYESCFIDLLDGNLTNKQVDVVLDFLRENPDLEEELISLENIILKPDSNKKIDFSALLKTELDQPDIFEEQCIRAIENELTSTEKVAFYEFIFKNTKARNDYRLFQATVSVPDAMIVYQNKNLLLKISKIPFYFLYAAAIVAFAMLFWFNIGNQEPDKVIIAARVEPLFEKPVSQINDDLLKSTLLKAIEPAETLTEIEEQLVADQTVNHPLENISLLSSTTAYASAGGEPNQFALQLSPFDIDQFEAGRSTELYPTVLKLLNEKVNEIDTKNELNKFAQLALFRLNSVSNEKFDYTTNDDGRLNRIEYNSRFLAFSFPVNKSK